MVDEHTPSSNAALELFVPGRLCLFGEHSDWAGAFKRYTRVQCKTAVGCIHNGHLCVVRTHSSHAFGVIRRHISYQLSNSDNTAITPGKTIVIGTQQGLYARVTPLAHPQLRITVTTDAGERSSTVLDLNDRDTLVSLAQSGGFWSYVAGTVHRIVTDFDLGHSGLHIDNYRTTLPLKKGLSSSAAICVLVTRAFNRLYGLRLSTRGEMQYAYEGERMTPSRCGKMDQALAFGSQPVLMTYDGDVLHIEAVQLRAPLHLVLVDLRAAKDTVVILAALQVCVGYGGL